jgi:DNA polymerase
MIDCTERCPTCPMKFNVVPADGPTDARILCIGEDPGIEGDRTRNPFAGQAGREYNDNYLLLAGLSRPVVRQTNVMRCRPDQNRKPKLKESEGCAIHHLPEELMTVQPEIVILMGATAVNTLRPDIDLESRHGIPFRGVVMGWECWIVPMWHPASGMHQTSMMIPLLEDFARLKPWLETGEWQWAVNKFKHRDYRLARTAYDVDRYFFDYPCFDWMGGDTESHDGVDFSMQISTKIGTGLMVLFSDIEAMDNLAGRLNAELNPSWGTAGLILHNAEADLRQFQSFAGEHIVYRDSMQEAYQLQNLPQGLKSLSYRLLGRKRKSWKELVGGYSRAALVGWMEWAQGIAASDLRQIIPQISVKTGKPIKPKIVKSPLESAFNRIITHTIKPQGTIEYDPWKQLKELSREFTDRDEFAFIVGILGPYPNLGIANCPLDVARDYGCSDADDTLAVAVELERLRSSFIGDLDIQDEDIDLPRHQ